MNSKVFIRDVFYGLVHTRFIWAILLACLVATWLALFFVELAHQEEAPSLDFEGTLPVKIEGRVPVTLVGKLASSRKGEVPVVLDIRGELPIVMGGAVEVKGRPIQTRSAWEEFWRCGEITVVAVTIGFGEAVPKSSIGKAICVLQAAIGVIILGVIVGVVSHAIGLQLSNLV